MAVYTLKFTVTAEGITPAEVQAAGVFGDHQAAVLEFSVPSEPTACRYRLEITDGSGAYDITELLDAKNGVVSYAIPRKWTAAGTAFVRLVAVKTDSNGNETVCFHASPARLFFEERDDGESMPAKLPTWQEIMTRAETVTNTVYEAYASGALHGRSGVYVGTGEMPADCNVQIDPTGDVFTLQNRKFLFIGDSYTEGSQLAEGEDTWAELVAHWLHLVFGVNCFKYAKGGASFGIAPESEYNFTSVLKQAVAGLNKTQRNEITDILVVGGCNDHAYGQSQIAVGMGAFSYLVRQEFPNAKIWLFYAGWSARHDIRQHLKATYLAYDYTAPQFGFACFNKVYQVLHNRNRLSADHIHPNLSGQRLLGFCVANAIMGSSNVPDSAVYHNVLFKETRVGRAYHNDNNIMLHIMRGSVLLDEPIDIIGTEFVKLFDVSCDILFGGADDDIVAQFTNTAVLNPLGETTTETKLATLVCRLVRSADGQRVELQVRTAEVENGAFITHKDITSISFFDNTIILPIWDA